MDWLVYIPLLASFLIALLTLPLWIKKAKSIGLVWENMNKSGFPKNLPGSGGVMVILAFVIGVSLYIAYQSFVLYSGEFLVEILAALTVIILVSGIGLIDDLMGWKKGGLSIRYRMILVALVSVPLVFINAGKSVLNFPFIGAFDIGLFYPLLAIPIGIVGATTTYNFLAGFNGLEAGQGIIILSALSLVAFLTGSPWLAIINLCMILALVSFLIYNFYPAKVLPGDVLTYAIGALIAINAILGDFEKIALFFFIPYIVETCLKLRGGLKKHSFGKPNKDGSLDLKYDKFYGLEHVSIYLLKRFNLKATEKRVVYLIWGVQIILVLIGFLIFREALFYA